MTLPLFNRSSSWITRRFGERIQKIPIDAGFSCPNLDGKLSSRGCIYCNNSSFAPFYSNDKLSISEQLYQGMAYFSKRYKCKSYFAFFQSFTCTYAPVEVLREKYNEALSVPGIAGLIIATRPDCLSDKVMELLVELGQKTFIRIELGVESFEDHVLQLANRCHDRQTALLAMKNVVAAKIPLCIHLILGLPGETKTCLPAAARIIGESGADMVKLHHLQVVKGSRLAEIFAKDPDSIKLHSLNSYLDALCEFIANLPTDVYIDRLINRVKPEQLLAPQFKIKGEAELQRLLEQRLMSKGLTQGTLFSKNC